MYAITLRQPWVSLITLVIKTAKTRFQPASGRLVGPTIGSYTGSYTGYFGIIPLQEYNGLMPWQVEYANQFKAWWDTLSEEQQEDLAATVELLMEYGPTLPYPYSSGIAGSRHSHMRELRTQSGGEPLRTFYAFDPRRVSILLIGGIKTGNDRFYEEYVPIADRLYDDHLNELRQEGNIP